MAYQKINRRRGFGKKKGYPLLTALITIFLCISVALGGAALWQKHEGQQPGLVDSSQLSARAEQSDPASSAESVFVVPCRKFPKASRRRPMIIRKPVPRKPTGHLRLFLTTRCS